MVWTNNTDPRPLHRPKRSAKVRLRKEEEKKNKLQQAKEKGK